MKKHLITGILAGLLMVGGCSDSLPPVDNGAVCGNLNGELSVLNINVLFTEVGNLETSFGHIADFVAQSGVDVILLQEVVGGITTGTDNSALELSRILSEKYGLEFNVVTAWDMGESNTFINGNAILSKCKIIKADAKKISTPGEIGTTAVSLSRNIQLAVIEIPGYGNVNVYNIHLCAKCDKPERELQLDRALAWIAETNTNSKFAILGGDMNFDRFNNGASERHLWYKITDTGFIDAYADYMINNKGETLDTLCEGDYPGQEQDVADEHCTKGVTDLNSKNPQRVDYIFTRNAGEITAAKVVFNNVVDPQQPGISDHAGVFVEINNNMWAYKSEIDVAGKKIKLRKVKIKKVA